MENGDSSASSDMSTRRNILLPPFTDHILPIPTCALSPRYSEISHQFTFEGICKISPKLVVKIVEDLSHQLCKYHTLALSLGTTADGEPLRKELAKMRQKACDIVTSARTQLSDAFRRADSLPKKDIVDLERSCRVLVACIHTLDRELRRTMHLYHLFPLIPDSDGTQECHFINTGQSDKQDCKNNNALIMSNYGPAEKYVRERENWQELEKEILEVNNLDVALHRDEVLGPVMDYLTLCPMGLDDISSSTASVDDVCSPRDTCGEDAVSRKKSSILCYAIAIMTVVCVGGGVLMGVIFMIVE